MKESLDPDNLSPAYICGRIFAVLEGIQRAALGKDINAGIRERFFTFASTSPSSAFGRLMKMTQNHLTKLKNEKPGLAVTLDKELQNLFSSINGFPMIFNLEEQGQFAIGYYHQKQDTFKRARENALFKDATEETENENDD
jgi:CRISPR-associated protein Csd1